MKLNNDSLFSVSLIYRHCCRRVNRVHPDPALLHRGIRHQGQRVGCGVHAAVRQILHHWCHRLGGRCARGIAAGCDAGARLLCQGEWIFFVYFMYGVMSLVRQIGHSKNRQFYCLTNSRAKFDLFEEFTELSDNQKPEKPMIYCDIHKNSRSMVCQLICFKIDI